MKLIRFFNTYEPVTSFYRDLCPYLADKGFKIEIFISGAVYREGGYDVDNAIKHRNIKIIYLTNKSKIENKNTSKIRIMISYMCNLILKTTFAKKSDLNCFLTQPPLLAIWGLVLKILKNENYACVTMDIYPEVLVKVGLISDKNIIYKILKMIRNLTLNHSGMIFVIGRCMRELLRFEGVSDKNIRITSNWVNDKTIYPVPHYRNTLRKELGLTANDFVIMYSGNMGLTHDFTDIIKVIKELKNINNLKFIFIGDGKRKKEIIDGTLGIDNVKMLPFQPIDKLAKSMSVGDLHFVTLSEGFEGLVVPSKTYGAFAAARPVIYQGPASSEIAQLIIETNSGTVVPPKNFGALKRTILDYFYNREAYRKTARNAHNVSINRVSKNVVIHDYYKCINNFLNSGMFKK